jgi:LacI family transcriptional regulator
VTRRPTIVDVARAAGVSKSTVSLVLNDSPLVRAATRAAVEGAMARLGYVYNRAAANLRGADAGLVGLVINDLRNPFFTEFATSAQMTFASRGYATVVANTDEDPAIQERVIGSMLEHGVAAFLISPAYGAGPEAFARIARAGAPALQVLRRADPRPRPFPFAAPDYPLGGRLAARHLIAAGARRIAFVGGLADRPVTRERMSGYLAALAEADLAPAVLPGRPSRAFGREAAALILAGQPRPDAALCFSDLVALGLVSGLAAAGVSAGAELRVAGFDGIEEAALAHPQLTSVHCDVAGFGRDAAATLLRWIETGDVPPPERRTPVDLVVRASSAVPP